MYGMKVGRNNQNIRVINKKTDKYYINKNDENSS